MAAKDRDDRKFERFKDIVRSDPTYRDKMKAPRVADKDKDEVYTSQESQKIRNKNKGSGGRA